MESAKDFLVRACLLADEILLAESPTAHDRAVASLTGYLAGLRDGYLCMDHMFEDISEAAIDEPDDK